MRFSHVRRWFFSKGVLEMTLVFGVGALAATTQQRHDVRMDLPLQPFWVIVSEPRRQIVHGRVLMPSEAKWTQEVKRLHMSSFYRQDALLEEAPAREWQSAHKRFDRQCIGLCLMRANCNPSLTTYLSPAQRSIDDYWQVTSWARESLQFVDVVAAAPCQDPFHMYASDINMNANFMFVKPTLESAHRGLASPLHAQSGSNGTVHDELQRWLHRHNNGVPLATLDSNSLPRLAMIVTAAHAFLLTSGKLSAYAFPWPGNTKKMRSLGIAICPKPFGGR